MQIPNPQRLDYQNGQFHWVFPDDISLTVHRQVDWYIKQARFEIDKFLATVQFTNFNHLAGVYLQIDTLTYEFTKPYYFAIAKLIGIPRISGLTSESRYRFFIQQLELNEGGLAPRPSQLDILMGCDSCEDEDRVESDKEVPSSGDILFDIETSLRLSFKHNADSLIKERGLVSCLIMMRQASRQLELAQEEAEKDRESPSGQSAHTREASAVTIEREALDPIYVRDREAIAKSLSSLDICLPDDD